MSGILSWDLETGRFFIADVGGNDHSTGVEEVRKTVGRILDHGATASLSCHEMPILTILHLLLMLSTAAHHPC